MEERIFKYIKETPEQIEEVSVKESELTEEELQLFYNRLVKDFNRAPEKAKAKFIVELVLLAGEEIQKSDFRELQP